VGNGMEKKHEVKKGKFMFSHAKLQLELMKNTFQRVDEGQAAAARYNGVTAFKEGKCSSVSLIL
jgi:hypothetical protein